MNHDISIIMDCSFMLRKSLEKYTETICRKYDLKFIELEILTVLMDGRFGDTASQIGQSKHISKAHLSKSLDHLRKKGYIYFDKDDEDHRLTHIALSNPAKEAAAEMNQVKQQLDRQLFHGLSDSDKKMAKELFQHFSDNLYNIKMSGL